ncbi:MAG: hypothetical protein F4Z17_09660 [Acidimicrobiia bacterium]|nr:hypothetical protein [Acidimicrobiia bacterium]
MLDIPYLFGQVPVSQVQLPVLLGSEPVYRTHPSQFRGEFLHPGLGAGPLLQWHCGNQGLLLRGVRVPPEPFRNRLFAHPDLSDRDLESGQAAPGGFLLLVQGCHAGAERAHLAGGDPGHRSRPLTALDEFPQTVACHLRHPQRQALDVACMRQTCLLGGGVDSIRQPYGDRVDPVSQQAAPLGRRSQRPDRLLPSRARLRLPALG